MITLRTLKAGLRSLLRKKAVNAELNEELDAYLEASIAHKRQSGMDPAAAQRAARIEMGSQSSVKHQVWTSRWESGVDGVLQDLRFGLRTLRKSPSFSGIALLSLALGIGANTAIFTLIHQVLLRQLPVRHAEQLVSFGKSESSGILGGIDLGTFDMFPWDFARDLEHNPGPFQGVAAYGSFSPKASVRPPQADMATPAEQARVSIVSGNYFDVLQAEPLFGRALTPADDASPGVSPVVVLSYHYWMQTLSADPAVLGKTLSINRTAFTIVGVMPEAFHGIKLGIEPPDIWAPISMQPEALQQPSLLTPHGVYFLQMLARLSPEAAAHPAALAQSQLWLDQQIRRGILSTEGTPISPERRREINRATVALVPAAHGISELRGQYGDSLRILMAITILVLLIACANLANFLLARAASRQREIATRLALGSSRTRIIRQILIETLLLSLSGGVLGLGLAFVATRGLISFVAQGSTNTALSPKPDLSVLLFTLGVSLLTGLLFGLGPALATARTGASESLGSSARTSTSGRAARLWPQALVTGQVMLALLLLIGAGLFLRTLRNLQNQDYGFDRSHLLIAELGSRLAGYRPAQLPALHQQLIDRIEAQPGVRSVALSATPPLSAGAWNSSISILGYVAAPKEDTNSILNRVSGRYFETASIPIVAGRAIGDGDMESGLKVAVINEALARHFFPKGNALGRILTINIDSVAGPWQIVGIARDTKVSGPHAVEARPMTYIPIAQIAATTKGANGAEDNDDRFASTLLVRTDGDPAKSIADLRRTVAQIDPNLPLLSIRTIGEQIENFVSHETLISRLSALFSVLALLLAAIGLYGVISYSVVRRTSEIGIRLALGAQLRAVLWMVLRESLLLLAVGLALGLPLAFATTRIIREQLFGISALDPATFAGAVTLLVAMTLLAALLPARRATQVDPMHALRCD